MASGLTKRQVSVLALIGAGKTRKEIAADLELSILTIGTYRKTLCTSVLATVLQSVPLLHSRPDQSNLLDLAPGDYLLIEDNHPQWQCKVTITP